MRRRKSGLLRRTALAFIAVSVLFTFLLPTALAEEEEPGIASIFSMPGIDIVSIPGGAGIKLNTTVYLFEDGSFLQYLADEAEEVLFSSGHFDGIGEFDLEKPVTGALTIDKVYQDGGAYANLDLTVGVSFSALKEHCLHLAGKDAKLVAAFTQAAAQKFVHTDGTEEYAATTWLYYDNGTFKQYAVLDGLGEVLFSSGDYLISGAFDAADSILTLHRTQKYQDGVGLAAYDSLHDYVIGNLDFLRVFPQAEE